MDSLLLAIADLERTWEAESDEKSISLSLQSIAASNIAQAELMQETSDRLGLLVMLINDLGRAIGRTQWPQHDIPNLERTSHSRVVAQRLKNLVG